MGVNENFIDENFIDIRFKKSDIEAFLQESRVELRRKKVTKKIDKVPSEAKCTTDKAHSNPHRIKE